MFTTSRKCGESIVIVPCGATANSSSVVIRIEAIEGDGVRFAIDAPEFFRILKRGNAPGETAADSATARGNGAAQALPAARPATRPDPRPAARKVVDRA